MKKISYISLTFIFSCLGIFVQSDEYSIFKESEQINLIDAKNVNYELIMNAFFFKNNILKPNAALLITDKEEIKADAEMFLTRGTMAHLCGYHYRILFWTNTDSLLGDRYVNQECEIFVYKPEEAQKKLTYYVKQLETAPTHYVYSLEISASMEPNEIREALKDSELNLFFIDGEQTRFPSISFSYEHFSLRWKNANGETDWQKSTKKNEAGASEKFEELVKKVKSVSSVVRESKIHYMGNGVVGDSLFYRTGHISLLFEIGTDLSKAITVLEQAGAKIEKINNPMTYLVQVVDTSANIKEIKHKLKKYNFIKEITEYNRI